ncbi:hypothetical protein O0550_23885 [Brevibacillus halotolerans]|uniref:hypothetical protein n=1 Tax=Brevibacillus TaxID=55080 RepID=UPI00215BC901|nr:MULTISPECIES: hypothetical protein [Brevibacillus]MCR8966186.1 hypothetical protein [Brevibacillus laterosporus]MCZ0838343.1 hypothetical protein [Brevibacillus halotolerans]
MDMKWVYIPDAVGEVPDNCLGIVLDQRSYTLQVGCFLKNDFKVIVIEKEFAKEYDPKCELEDLQCLMLQATFLGDYEWYKELLVRYNLLVHLLDKGKILLN